MARIIAKASAVIEVTTLVPAVKASAAIVEDNAFVANWGLHRGNRLLAYSERRDAIVDGFSDLEVGAATTYIEGLKAILPILIR